MFILAAIVGISFTFILGILVHYLLTPRRTVDYRARQNPTERVGRSQVSPPQIETITTNIYPYTVNSDISQAIHTVPVDKGTASRVCPYCGNRNGYNFLFCNNCGLELE